MKTIETNVSVTLADGSEVTISRKWKFEADASMYRQLADSKLLKEEVAYRLIEHFASDAEKFTAATKYLKAAGVPTITIDLAMSIAYPAIFAEMKHREAFLSARRHNQKRK